MVVYVEYVIIDNFFISYFIGCVSYLILRLKQSNKRIIFAAIVGTASALFYPFFENNVLLAFLKCCTIICTSIILFWKKVNVISGCLVQLVVTFAFGGIIFALNYVIAGKIVEVNHAVYDFSIGLLIGLALIVKWFTYIAYKKISGTIVVRKNNYKFVVWYKGKELTLRGFIDTGNRLTFGRDFLPVVIVKAIKMLDIVDCDEFYRFINNGEGEFITITTVAGGSKRLMVIKPDKFELITKHGREIKDVYIAVSFAPIIDSDDYDAILHPSLT